MNGKNTRTDVKKDAAKTLRCYACLEVRTAEELSPACSECGVQICGFRSSHCDCKCLCERIPQDMAMSREAFLAEAVRLMQYCGIPLAAA